MSQDPILRFHGAAGTVTGSCHMVEAGGARILIDCGLFQGSKTEKELNYRSFPFDPARLDAVILTHAHIDHSGLLPKLVRAGYGGSIYATRPTADLCAVMLPDSGHIQEMEVEQLNRRNLRRGRSPVVPIYTMEDATAALTQFKGVPLNAWHDAAKDVRFRFWNAGHLLGSASVEMEVPGAGRPLRLLFSGDIGPGHKLLQHDPEGPAGCDVVVCESTYGDTDRTEATDAVRRAALRAEVRRAAHPGGALLIPSFAVERTQELLADLVQLMDAEAIPRCPILIDSPLATRASEIFQRYTGELDHGDQLAAALRSAHVRFTESVEQSKAISTMRGFHIIIAASGMCEAGRIRHHLKNWLWRETGTVLLVGFQAQGTLGRILEEGAPTVRIQGDEIQVRAQIRRLDLYSGHADGPELVAWLQARQPAAGGIFLVHGEDAAQEGLVRRLAEAGVPGPVVRPRLDAAYRLTGDGPVDVSRTAPPPRIDPVRSGHRDWHNDFQSLVLDLESALDQAADDRSRAAVLRRLRRALTDA